MKHLNQNPIALLLVLINFLVLDSYSQQHFPLPDSNASWIAKTRTSEFSDYDKFFLSPNREDTIINGESYIKVFYTNYLEWNDGSHRNLSVSLGITRSFTETRNEKKSLISYIGAFRNDLNGKSYFFPSHQNGIQHEVLLQDFSAETGDTIKDVSIFSYNNLDGEYDFIVDSINFRNNGPYLLKYLYLKPVDTIPYYEGNSMIWVEKIGCLNYGLLNGINCGLNATTLQCMQSNDTLYYSSEELWPNCYFFDGFNLRYEPGICELPTGVGMIDLPETIRIFPNPFTNSFQIINLSLGLYDIKVINILGNTVFDNRIEISEENSTQSIIILIQAYIF